MNHRQKPPQHRPQNPAYRQAFERLDKALAENAPPDYSAKIQRVCTALFGHVAELQESGTVKLPE